MSDFEQTHPSELEEGDEVKFEGFDNGYHEGMVESSWYVPSDDTYQVRLGSRVVYTVTEEPEEFDARNYVAEPSDLYVDTSVSDEAYDAAAKLFGWEDDKKTEKLLAESD